MSVPDVAGQTRSLSVLTRDGKLNVASNGDPDANIGIDIVTGTPSVLAIGALGFMV